MTQEELDIFIEGTEEACIDVAIIPALHVYLFAYEDGSVMKFDEFLFYEELNKIMKPKRKPLVKRIKEAFSRLDNWIFRR